MIDHAIISRDAHGVIIGWNSGATQLLGYASSAVIGKSIEALIPADDLADLNALIDRLRRGEKVAPTRIPHVHEDGTLRSLAVLPTLILGPEGEVAMITHLTSAGDLGDRTWLQQAQNSSSDPSRSEQERLFRKVIDSLPPMIWRAGPDGRVDLVTGRWEAFTGRSAEELCGHRWLECVHPDDRELIVDRWSAARELEEPLEVDIRLRDRDGQYHWMEVRGCPIVEEGATVCWIGSFTDVHEMRETRRALLEERRRLARLVASAPGAIYEFRIGPNGHASFPFVSPGVADLYPVDLDELMHDARSTMSLNHPNDVGRVMSAVRHSAEHLTPFRCEWRICNPEKGEIWAEARSVPVREADGGTVWYGILLDITERKHAEELLHVSQARLQAVVAAGRIGTWVRDMQNDTLWWDEKMLEIWGRTASEVNGRPSLTSLEFVHPEDRAVIGASLDKVGTGPDTMFTEFRVIRGDGSMRWVAVNAVFEVDGDGKPVRMIGACTDITDRKREEDTQRRSQRLEALGTLAGGIAHDFNNILLAISGNTRLAMTDLSAEHPSQICLREIDKASARATSLVQRILAFSRQTEPKREVLQLQSIVEEALRLMRSTLPALIEINTHFARDIPPINADSTQIHQVIMNLLTNSAHAIGDRPGAVSVSIDSVRLPQELAAELGSVIDGPYVRLSVGDTGSGMSETTLERIFDPFFTTKPAGQGTGLGLSVVHGIVRGHRGAISVESAPGRGTTFRLYFPSAGSRVQQTTEERPEPSPGKGQRIMYVDDEDSLVYLVTRKLERLGYRIAGFTDPAAALSAFQAEPKGFDVVVTDMSMPGMSGFHLAKAILELRPAMPVLMTSGYVRTQDREAALQLGVRDLIMKPNTIDELGQVLASLFESAPVTKGAR